MANKATTEKLQIFGRQLALAHAGNLLGNGIKLGTNAVDASITVAAESADVREIAVVVKDANGDAVDERVVFWAYLTLDANPDAFVVTGGSTGIALGTAAFGAVLAVVAKKIFLVVTEADGTLSLKWTDTGTEVAFLNLMLPNGNRIVSTALTNA